MTSDSHSKVLIVEGKDDLYCVCHLMGHYIDWPRDSVRWPVWIVDGKGRDTILGDKYLRGQCKVPHRKVLGILLDADDDPFARYQRVRQLLGGVFPAMPDSLPSGGLIVDGVTGHDLSL